MNAVKLSALIAHIQDGGSLEQEDLAEALTLSPKSVKSIGNYLTAAGEKLDEEFTIGGENPFASDEDEEEEEPTEPEEPEEEEEEEEPEPEPEPSPAPKAKKKKEAKDTKPYRFFFERPDGTAVELEQVKKGGNVITFKEKAITDIVQLMVKGEVVEVDLVPLRQAKQDEESEFGMSNELLLKLALAARG